jgi:glycosyltransferase involved in cell wall biosynthesis
VTGALVDDQDPEAFAAAVRRLLAEPGVHRRASSSSAALARGYTWREAASKLLSLYDELVAGQLLEC